MSRLGRTHSASVLFAALCCLAPGSQETAHAASSTWSAPVSPPMGCGSALAINAAGTLVVAGYMQTGSGQEAFTVEVCTSNDGEHWVGPTAIGQGEDPAVALAPDGSAVVVWQGGMATAPDIEASARLAGGGFGEPVAVSQVGGRPVVAMDGSGNAVAAWSAPNLDEPVQTASLPAGGHWTSPQTLVANGGAVNVATSSVGGVVIGWRSRATNAIEVASGTILGGVGAPVVLGTTTGRALHPASAALDDAGNAVFAFQSTSQDGNLVVTRTPSGVWSTPTRLSPNPAGVAVAIDRAGNAVAAFSEFEGTGSPSIPSFHPVDGTWGPPALLSAPNDRGLAALAGDAAGGAVVAWTNSDGEVEAVTVGPSETLGSALPVGMGAFQNLAIVPGQAVLWTLAGISKESVN